MKRNALKGAVLIAAAAVALAGCSASAGTTADIAAVQGQVKVQTVEKQSMGDPREQVATVSAAVDLNVVAKAGGDVVQVVKHNGERVKQGEVILRLESDTAVMSVETAQAALSSAEQTLEATRENNKASRMQLVNSVTQLEDAYKEAVASGDQTTIDNAKRSLDTAKQQLSAFDSTNSLAQLEAQVVSARTSLEQAQTALDNYSVTAPADGILTGVTAQVGQTLSAGSPVGTLQNIDQVKITADLSEEYAELARNKKEIVYYASGDSTKKKKAQVVYLAELPDATTKMYTLELAADNKDGSLKPGDRVQVQLTTEQEEVKIAVPSLSIVREGSQTFVFVLNGSTAEKREVQLGRINGAYQEILGGLKEGEQIIVSGQHSLTDGQQVEVAKAAAE
ncbi:efflux RND transporter periplasmic adaptor subunit [Paenibacillus thailandensis]|uniref:Efflux RND transporter periplasmic adaptor subunit n=1 Tax=Paenibacillus thailandensis TaxID=393250 RepID=A0ABW5QUZ5_9BACL